MARSGTQIGVPGKRVFRLLGWRSAETGSPPVTPAADGHRLLLARRRLAQMREFERAFSQSVEEFLEVYPSYIDQVRPELNGLFREERLSISREAPFKVRSEA
ncbi:hypothetical protein [Edaphobacter aggregans]|uniref:hypothetical protein n=1 Tax=Edaphobacter aggregans TaxID=570835 RepID=UPI0012FC79B8|nr:hypothetical protein [Edaphobacter aggregans]